MSFILFSENYVSVMKPLELAYGDDYIIEIIEIFERYFLLTPTMNIIQRLKGGLLSCQTVLSTGNIYVTPENTVTFEFELKLFYEKPKTEKNNISVNYKNANILNIHII